MTGAAVDDADNESNARQPSKKEQRQLDAKKRQRLKPLTDDVRRVEKVMAAVRSRLQTVEEGLADEALYTATERQAELTGLLKEQAELKSALEGHEWDWLEASEKLELAGAD